MIIALAQAAIAAPPNGEVVVGWAGNEAVGYGFASLQQSLVRVQDASLGLRVTASQEYYSYVDATGLNDVQSPGLSVGPGFTYQPRDLALGFAVGLEARRATVRLDAGGPAAEDLVFDATFSGNLVWRPRERADLYALFSFSATNAYLWSQVGATRPVIPFRRPDTAVSLWAGLEAGTSGNVYSRVYEVGPVLEMPVAPLHAALSVRGGVSWLSADGLPSVRATTFGAAVYWAY